MGKLVASYEVRIHVRRSGDAEDGEPDPTAPTNTEVERAVAEAVAELTPTADVTAESERLDK